MPQQTEALLGFEPGRTESSMGISSSPSPRPIRWRKGEIIGCGAYGRVYMGMNLDSGELLAIKQVLIAANSSSKAKAQSQIQELEEEVKLLRNLSHPNIVRYLGTAREDNALNILMEFVPGGSIASLLGKFGSFTEPVIRMYTKQLLLGLEYLHNNDIMHRDIKGANILVDNKGCIKLADFGASKKVVELATVTGAKSMKGTPYWMAPEVVRQTGHSLSADVWSVGCTVIEMATGKPPWSEQFQEVAALFHIGTTLSHPPIPEQLSSAAKDFLHKCLEKEPNLRPTATELLKHPFIVGGHGENHSLTRSSFLGHSVKSLRQSVENSRDLYMISNGPTTMRSLQYIPNIGSKVKFPNLKADWESNVNDNQWNNANPEDLYCSVRLDSIRSDYFTKSFNPMCEPIHMEDNIGYKLRESGICISSGLDGDMLEPTNNDLAPQESRDEIRFESGFAHCDDDDEVTESKIRAFLDEKALELKKLQTPLYEEFYNTTNATPNQEHEIANNVGSPLLAKCKSPNNCNSEASYAVNHCDSEASISSGSPAVGGSPITDFGPLGEISSPRLNQLRGHSPEVSTSPNISSSERYRIWKEELDQELERKREELKKRKGSMKSSPKNFQRLSNRSAGSASSN